MSQRTRREVLVGSAAVVGMMATVGRGAADELLGTAPAPGSAKPPADTWRGLKVGVATYSLRAMDLDACIAAVRRVGLNYVSIKDMHLPLKSSPDERKAVAAKFKDAGITLLSCGVVTMKNDEAECRAAFEYARDIAVPVLVCNPHPDSFGILDKLVKEFDIKLAIHNHGPESEVFKSPYDVMKIAEKHDERIGVCVDVGHTARAGVDPADVIRKLAPRLYDVHLKDVAVFERRNNAIEMGRGLLDLPAIMRALLDVTFQYHTGIEFEKDEKDVLPGLAESVGYLRGLMRVLPS